MSSKILVALSKILTAAAIIIIVGCSGASSGAVPSGVFAPASLVQANGTYRGLQDLYVADYGFGSVKLLTNKGYKPDGEITYGMNGPYDVTLDKARNPYVANRVGDNISEYAPGATQPMFVYNAGMRGPLTLSVDHAAAGGMILDQHSNKVFVIDYVSGKTIRQLSSGHGLGVPFGAVYGPNNVL